MADENQTKPAGKILWVACRAERRDGSKGCGSNSATLSVLATGQAPGAEIAGNPQQKRGVQKTFDNLLQGKTIRYKCCACGGIFTVCQ